MSWQPQLHNRHCSFALNNVCLFFTDASNGGYLRSYFERTMSRFELRDFQLQALQVGQQKRRWVQLYFSRRPHAAADACSSLGLVSSEKNAIWALSSVSYFLTTLAPPFKILPSENLLQFYCEISKKMIKIKCHLIALSQVTLCFFCLEFSYFQGER